MDVPYNKSGASSRAHYQIVRNVENAPHHSERLLLHEVERIRQRFVTKMLSTADIRKDLISLLYCLNSSFRSINSATLSFALPSAVHLAEAGSRVGEKRVGYLFCWEVMQREHELQLMLVNTLRKDLTSPSVAKINLALESLVNLPSLDVIPAVQTRCIELLSHPSPRIRVLVMNALHSLARYSPDLLNDENIKELVLKRLSDVDESVVRNALRLGLSMISGNLLENESIMRPCVSLVSRVADKQTARRYSSTFSLGILDTVLKLYEREEPRAKGDHASELIQSLLGILRRAVKHDQQSVILECFRLLGRFPTTTVAQYILKMSSQPTELDQREGLPDRPQLHFVHPVARIRHFLSSRTVNEHYLFLSCLVCLDPPLWAGITKPSWNLLTLTAGEQQVERDAEEAIEIPLILDQLEVERVLSFLESEDAQIRALTLRILVSLDPSLVENCYQRALDALRTFGSSNSANDQARKVILQRLIELAFTISLGNEKLEIEDRGRILIQRLEEVIDVTGDHDKVNGTIVESVLDKARKENTSNRRTCIISLLTLLQAEDSQGQSGIKPLNKTLFLVLVALACEVASILTTSTSDIMSTICLFATTLHSSALSMQEPLLLCMARFVVLLTAAELSSLEIEDVRRVVHELSEASLGDKKMVLVLKRCEQFEKALSDPNRIRQLLGSNQSVSLPEFALILDRADRRLSSPQGKAHGKPSIPLTKLSSPSMNNSELAALSQSKLRYDAYAPPPTSTSRLIRVRSHSSTASGQSSNRASSRASSTRTGEPDADDELSRTVTAGELALATGFRNEFARTNRSKGGKMREVDPAFTDAAQSDTSAKRVTDLLTIDSPFLVEPLVDVDAHPSTTPPPSSPYVSASTSLRTSPEPEQSFEELWSGLAANTDAFSARGWCDDGADVAVRRLQSMGLRMDVLSADDTPFKGDLKVMLHSAPVGSFNLVSSALLRLHEEDDGSCRWQVKCTDKEVGVKVKELMG